jgi:hypothetical protein
MAEEKKRRLRGPVRWLLDRQLLVNLREIVLYSAFGTRIDPRHWMAGLEVDLADDFEGGEFWFDYLSDTGDGMTATYSVAYLAYSDLWVSSAVKPGAVAFEKGGSATQELPRGAFLLIGGDTAYHVADYETLAERFQYPFNLAFRHLVERGKMKTPKRRPLFGIPGNHDYYDFLDGFNRQFRRPYNDERRYDEKDGGDQPQLVLEGFARKQRASYFSLKLPFDWRLWSHGSAAEELLPWHLEGPRETHRPPHHRHAGTDHGLRPARRPGKRDRPHPERHRPASAVSRRAPG